MNTKTIVITGANSGIGLECVKQFLSNNWHVCAISRSSDNLDEIKHSNLSIYKCDVSNWTKLGEVVSDIENSFVHIDVLINNAGIAHYNELEHLEHLQISEMIKVNIQGFTNVLEAILPKMQKVKHGTIINISSLADRSPRPKSSIYAATKAYVKNLSDSLRLGNAKYNIRIMNLSPSNINTPLLQSIKKMESGYIEVEDFVDIIRFIINLPQNINIRDMVIAPTEYEG